MGASSGTSKLLFNYVTLLIISYPLSCKSATCLSLTQFRSVATPLLSSICLRCPSQTRIKVLTECQYYKNAKDYARHALDIASSAASTCTSLQECTVDVSSVLDPLLTTDTTHVPYMYVYYECLAPECMDVPRVTGMPATCGAMLDSIERTLCKQLSSKPLALDFTRTEETSVHVKASVQGSLLSCSNKSSVQRMTIVNVVISRWLDEQQGKLVEKYLLYRLGKQCNLKQNCTVPDIGEDEYIIVYVVYLCSNGLVANLSLSHFNFTSLMCDESENTHAVVLPEPARPINVMKEIPFFQPPSRRTRPAKQNRANTCSLAKTMPIWVILVSFVFMV